MTKGELEMKCERLRKFFKEELCHAFPYADACVAVRREGDLFADLVPDLARYHAEIAGCCAWGKRMLTWDAERRQAAREACGRSFMETCANYARLRQHLGDLPKLRSELELYDDARHRVLELLDKGEEVLG